MREPRGLNRAMHWTRIHCGWPELADVCYSPGVLAEEFFFPLVGTGGGEFFFFSSSGGVGEIETVAGGGEWVARN